MKDGFIKIASATPKITVADTTANCKQILSLISQADEQKVNLVVFPELCITSYTCGDLFFNDTLLTSATEKLCDIAKFTIDKYPIVIVGLPIKFNNKIYNCAAVVSNGDILGIIPKSYLSNNNGFSEGRHFESGINLPPLATLTFQEYYDIPFSNEIIFSCEELNEFSFGVEICEDLFAPIPKSQKLCINGANIIANLSASNEIVAKSDYRRNLITVTSKQLNCGYIFANSGHGESTTDLVFSGHSMIAENGILLAENQPFEENNLLISEIDVKLLQSERSKNPSFTQTDEFYKIYFQQKIIDTVLTRRIPPCPFDISKTALKEVLDITAHALKKRIEHTCTKKCVLGISGGLDSTLALFITAYALKLLNQPLNNILSITIPCFGTTDRTKNNSKILCESLGVDFKEINIRNSVTQHFIDIDQDPNLFDVTFENSQARERTQVIMDIANKENGIVIGTGDLSELALGWATYNGDHMSMYAVNAGIPKTLIRHLLSYIAENCDKKIETVLLDILDTPISPELIPTDKKGNISQKTEDLVGPYELHDFFIYYFLRYGFSLTKIHKLANIAFKEKYDYMTIKKWLTTFARRFLTQQFKRSCLPDGPKVIDIGVSPRGTLCLPSDAAFSIWLDEIVKI